MTESRFHKDYLPLAPTLYRVAFYILESEADAEDAVQELYLKLWKAGCSLDGIDNPKAYSIRILKNICIDRIRKAGRITIQEEIQEQPAEPVQEDEIDARTRLNKVLEAVKALPERQRTVLMLRAVEGLSYEEISARTGMNQLTCRVLLSQARTKLKSLK